MGHKQKTLRMAAKVVELLREDRYVPEIVLFIGTGDPVEARLFTEAWPECRCLGFDAHPRYAENSIIPTEHVAVVEDQDLETVKFWIRRGRAMASSLWPNPDPNVKNTPVEVPATTLDKIRSSYGLEGKRIFMWGDCEGGELGAMKAGPKLMLDTRWLHLEMIPTVESGRPGWPLADEVDSWLVNRGYILEHVHGSLTRAHDRTYRMNNCAH